MVAVLNQASTLNVCGPVASAAGVAGTAAEPLNVVAGFGLGQRARGAAGGARVDGQVGAADPVVGRWCRWPHRAASSWLGASARTASPYGLGVAVPPSMVATVVKLISGVVERVLGPDPVGLAGARRGRGVGEGQRLAVPPGRVGGHRADHGGRAQRRAAQHLVGQLPVVPVPGRGPRHPGGAGGQRDHGRLQLVVALRGLQVRAVHPEPGQPLLVDPVDPRELAADQHVLGVAGDRPAGLALPGEGARVQRRLPVQQLRRRVPVVGAADVDPAAGVRRWRPAPGRTGSCAGWSPGCRRSARSCARG